MWQEASSAHVLIPARNPLAGQWHLIPGNPWQPDIEKALSTRKLAPFFVGPSGFGRFHEREEEIIISDLRQVAERF
jgi:hypothetical protein